MIIEEHNTPNLRRFIELFLRLEAEQHGATVKVGEQNGLDADVGNHRRCDGERGNHAVCGMAG